MLSIVSGFGKLFFTLQRTFVNQTKPNHYMLCTMCVQHSILAMAFNTHSSFFVCCVVMKSLVYLFRVNARNVNNIEVLWF